nr:hypothetical protein [Planctomycetota bacterium]
MRSLPQRFTFAVCALVVSGALRSQVVELRFTEVLVDPVGVDAGRQVLEYENVGNVEIDTGRWFLAIGTTTVNLPSVRISPGVIGRIHVGRAGTSSPADIFLPTAPVIGRSEGLALFKSASFQDPTSLVDFVSFGGGQGYIAVATQASQWKSTFESVILPTMEGHSIAHYGRDTWGLGHAAEDWYRDGTPTLGLPNDPGSMFAFSAGCPSFVQSPGLGLLNELSRAWIGEVWELDLYNLPQSPNTAIMFLATRPITPLPLDPIGMNGCNLGVDLATAFTTTVPTNQGSGLLRTTL